MGKAKRNNIIKKLYREGKTFAEIGRRFNISSSRVHQIVTGYRSFAANGFSFKRFPNLITIACATKGCENKPTDVHHKDGNSGNNEPDNLIYICFPCHAQTHRTMRRKYEKTLNMGRIRRVGVSQLVVYNKDLLEKLPVTLTRWNKPFAVVLSVKEYEKLKNKKELKNKI